MNDNSKNIFCITDNYDNINWDEVFPKLLPVLMAYAFSILGNSSSRLKKSKEDVAYDLSMEAIHHFIENPNKFEPSRNNDLVNYLKFNILRRLVFNYKNKKSYQNELIYDNEDKNGISVQNLFCKVNDIHEDIDYKKTIEDIREGLNQTPELLELFELRITNDSKPQEIRKELGIDNLEYNNRFRRMKTIIKNSINSRIEIL